MGNGTFLGEDCVAIMSYVSQFDVPLHQFLHARKGGWRGVIQLQVKTILGVGLLHYNWFHSVFGHSLLLEMVSWFIGVTFVCNLDTYN